MEEPSKHVRLDNLTSADLSEKLRRESADSGTSSSEVVTRAESPLCGKSESDSGRPETPNDKQVPLNPFSVSALMASSTKSPQGSKSSYKSPPGTLPASAFSNPSLHSAAVHHRNLQAAAAANLQANFSHLLPNLLANSNLAHQLAALQQHQQGGAGTQHQTPFQPLINPLFNPLLSQYSPLFQQRPNPLGKTSD